LGDGFEKQSCEKVPERGRNTGIEAILLLIWLNMSQIVRKNGRRFEIS
jgi:hypothetical protein